MNQQYDLVRRVQTSKAKMNMFCWLVLAKLEWSTVLQSIV